MSGAGKRQDKVVSVYWTADYLARLDKVCLGNSMRRNDYIKEAVRKQLEKDEQGLADK